MQPKVTGDGRLELDDRLLAAAASLFCAEGISDVTVERAAMRAGVDVEEARRRYPSSAYLARGIYEAVLDEIPERIDSGMVDLPDALCAIVIAEIEMLQPYKAFVRRMLLELLNPLSPQLLLQLPVMQKVLALVSEQIAVARGVGQVGRWVVPNIAALGFGALHTKIITYWLTLDDSAKAQQKLLETIDRDIRVFVGLLKNPLGFLRVVPAGSAAAPSHYHTRPIAGSASARGRAPFPREVIAEPISPQPSSSSRASRAAEGKPAARSKRATRSSR